MLKAWVKVYIEQNSIMNIDANVKETFHTSSKIIISDRAYEKLDIPKISFM